MQPKPILIHTHFHYQRTGVTRSIENVIPFLATKYDTYVYGNTINSRKISFTKILKLVFSKKYFVIHCHRNNEIIRALLFRFLGGNFKLVSTRHAEAKPSSLTTFLLQKTDVIISLTKSMAANLSFPTVIIGHGVNTNVFKPNPEMKIATILQKNSISCAGRVRKAKGQEVLLEAVCPLLKNQPDWALVIVGKVDKPVFLDKLKEIVEKNNVESQVYFLEETSDIATIYQASHTVVVPSFTEGFSLVCAEAMACGCNVVATENVGIHSELITPNKNGYLFEAGNRMQLQQIMKKIMGDELHHLGTDARKVIEENYSAEAEAENLMGVYRK